MRSSFPSAVSLGGAIIALLTGGLASSSQQLPLTSDFVCEHPPYKVHLVSSSPLVIYITNFLTDQERAHLQEITKDTFSHSGVQGSSGAKAINRARTSQSTNVPRDTVVRCIEERALLFQGLDTPRTHLEPLQLVKYGRGEHFHFHTDWFPNPEHARPDAGGNRLSSFFVYVRVDPGTTGGGTNFPAVDAPAGNGNGSSSSSRWCEAGFVDCDEPWDAGVTFRPVEGNAVFWRNLLPGGGGDDRTLHAGLPVTSGGKIGMNIWTREGPVSEKVRGPDV
ncbi:2OG-Fe(II) oxygenase superfamily protein [Phialemonium atrogriseum]|uniref:2OG-Fe(II) oxygenase superfamily protein n=1 Tax=Phialemonium atrogriseum TaxID=1093897 RepID=A0AAJ0CD65_9PEZI|nr:2OG-Fe(II) oxygenase superfamily protein [Phialemonium atrogriseum]KAK1772161.1 2OG-Fe(II) oxygenase superfamily protein [Phialemonium atrogriseum]